MVLEIATKHFYKYGISTGRAAVEIVPRNRVKILLLLWSENRKAHTIKLVKY
jgi:hypothetical protein